MIEIFQYLWHLVQNYGIVLLIMVTVLEVLMWLLKWPIKLLTSKIQNETIRKLANKVLIVLVFGLSVGLYALGHLWLPQYVAFEPSKIIMTGAFAIVLYSLADGVIPKISTFKKVEALSNEASKTIEPIVDSVKKDECPSNEEVKSAVDSFSDLVNATKKEVNGKKRK